MWQNYPLISLKPSHLPSSQQKKDVSTEALHTQDMFCNAATSHYLMQPVNLTLIQTAADWSKHWVEPELTHDKEKSGAKKSLQLCLRLFTKPRVTQVRAQMHDWIMSI